jgi:hypothetical protein
VALAALSTVQPRTGGDTTPPGAKTALKGRRDPGYGRLRDSDHGWSESVRAEQHRDLVRGHVDARGHRHRDERIRQQQAGTRTGGRLPTGATQGSPAASSPCASRTTTGEGTPADLGARLHQGLVKR